jgi:putative transposase
MASWVNWRIMMGKRQKPEEIMPSCGRLRGTSMADAIRSIGVTEVTYYRWRSEYGGMKLDQVKRLKELEVENARLRKAVSDLTLDKLILKEAARGNFFSIRGS